MTYRYSSLATTGPTLSRRSTASANDDRGGHARFVTQSHALGAPSASPGSILVAAAVAVAVLVLGLRLSRS